MSIMCDVEISKRFLTDELIVISRFRFNLKITRKIR